MSMSDWPRKVLSIKEDVTLDPNNVRLEEGGHSIEADIMADLFANEDALGLVEEICKVGYLTHETPIVVRSPGKYIVVEGNRRIAALKAIQNPHLVPNLTGKIRTLLSAYPQHPKISQVEVIVAPSREAADVVVAAIHTGSLRKKWTPARQAAFFQAQLEAGRSVPDLIARYPTADVKKFLTRAQIVTRVKRAAGEDGELRRFVESAKFKKSFSTLTRIADSQEFRSLVNFKMSDDGTVDFQLPDVTLDSALQVVLTGLANGDLNTRTLNKTSIENPRYSRLLADIRSAIGEDAHEQSSNGAHIAARPPRKVAQHARFLEMRGIEIPDSYGKGFRQTLEELSVLDVTKFPMAAFVMMRATLEKGIKSFARSKGQRISAKGKKYVFLNDCVLWLISHVEDTGNTRLLQVVRNLQSFVDYFPVSQDKLNAALHNDEFTVATRDVQQMWPNVLSVVEYLVVK